MAGMPFQANSCWERVWADPDMGAILTIKGLVGAHFFVSFCCCRQKGTRALSLDLLRSNKSIGVRKNFYLYLFSSKLMILILN